VQEEVEQHVHEEQQEVLPEGQLAKEQPLLQDAPLWMHRLGLLAMHVQQALVWASLQQKGHPVAEVPPRCLHLKQM